MGSSRRHWPEAYFRGGLARLATARPIARDLPAGRSHPAQVRYRPMELGPQCRYGPVRTALLRLRCGAVDLWTSTGRPGASARVLGGFFLLHAGGVCISLGP